MLDEAWPAARRRGGPALQSAPAGLQPWVIPFDYGARFELKGEPGNVVPGVINISPDGVFVATAIGYGFEEDRARPTPVLNPATPLVPGDVTLERIPADALVQGFRVSPRLESLVFTSPPVEFSDLALATASGETLLQKIIAPREVSFLFSVVESSSGRELQDEPTHNLASLGISNGERPFRPLARPLSFLPRSTVRLQVEERSEDTKGTLFIVLYGYRAITGTHCPEPLMRSLQQLQMPPAGPGALLAERVIPFDYAAIVRLEGRPGNLVEAEVPINAEGGFVATALGYGLEPLDAAVALRFERINAVRDPNLKNALAPILALTPRDFEVWDETKTIDLANIPLRLFPPDALRDGVRIRPSHLRLALGGAGLALRSVPAAAMGEMFESLNRPEAVSFRYEILDAGTGRDLQNLPLGNIAGLGIANGERPFKRFARPMLFLPRSTIRVRVEERSGRGNLYFVFQGYKLLGLPYRGVL
jgi:hypothetical protein